MRIWLVTIGEPLPFDANPGRLLRTGLFAKHLASRGHDVIWWNSNFDHVHKIHRRPTSEVVVQLAPRFSVRLLHGPAYHSNVSIKRILNHRAVAQDFVRQTSLEPKPDIIVAGLPIIELCVASTRYGKTHSIPVVVDLRDMWPDILLEVLPSRLRFLGRLALASSFREMREACRDATALFGITCAFVEWGLSYAGRARSPNDCAYPLAYPQTPPDEAISSKGRQSWAELGIGAHNAFVVCYFGYLGRQVDLRPVIEAARLVHQRGLRIQVVLCGTGKLLDDLRRQARDCPNVFLPGWVGQGEIWSLLRLASAGLAPYNNTRDFQSSIPNKAIEYLSAGLPILTSLEKGVLVDLLTSRRCGTSYFAGQAPALADLLSTWSQNSNELRTLAQNALSLYQDSFVAEKVFRAMEEHLAQIVAASASRGPCLEA